MDNQLIISNSETPLKNDTSPVGVYQLKMFMYDGELTLNADSTFKIYEISDLGENMILGTWERKHDTIALIKSSFANSSEIDSLSMINQFLFVANNLLLIEDTIISKTSWEKQ